MWYPCFSGHGLMQNLSTSVSWRDNRDTRLRNEIVQFVFSTPLVSTMLKPHVGRGKTYHTLQYIDLPRLQSSENRFTLVISGTPNLRLTTSLTIPRRIEGMFFFSFYEFSTAAASWN